ncbi:uncharacterized protein LOC6543293 [Drosophila erecta]|nr:uncharacterized protein LOC6543293 [Drosophila erecta]XP_015014989.1 uncharacterized protein LOC6543293 [Drosophila erecta]XP_026834235.1 uncharacterized protein LOC6543293 [Drosophila erecta]KQS70412.1 uncharacterized protein Dere_GG23968, isoform B [Drosophila erecta]KQS70413.1 uncharacterized protein Dere_GG23968, isoform C [Drosophila erecta]KQS70414.1 uncharacterized protein Dere_GG23968, isoform D [Drosophila erecta]
MDEKDKAQHNMISNLPLLFANGYPTSLEKITESQLENFIPFMVQCSLGHINLPKKIDCSEPEWWPESAPFEIPLKKPKAFVGNWMEKMKEIVVICYQFHKSLFLLRFCNDLAAYEHASLRFINNYNSTTSLYDRRNNKLLVTFRNENMSYDRQQKNRKCLLLQKNSSSISESLQHMMVEPPPFDIYLCDNCDAELYSKEAILEHENICCMEDDVILCDSPEPDNKCDGKNEDIELRNAFLLNFNLQSKFTDNSLSKEKQKTFSFSEETSTETSNRKRRLPSRRNRTVHSFSRCSFIPISSPAGQQLLKSTKQTISMEYISERQERLDRFCYTPLIIKSNTRPKYFEKKSNHTVHCTFKKSHEHNYHIYSFPRRQFVKRRDTTENFLFLNSPLIKQCRPISVRLKKISEHVMEEQNPTANTKLNIRLTRHNSLNSHWRISPTKEVVVDTIDLCSSDDDEQQEQTMGSPKRLGSDALTIIKLTHNNRKSSRRSIEPSKCAPEPESVVDNTVKPLQQSLYIFSNYKANSVNSRCAVDSISNHSLVSSLSTSNTFSDSQGHRKEYNQENCNFSKNLVALTDWYAHSANSEKSTTNQTTDSSTFEAISAAPPFNSTGRVISIDLTS